MAARIVIAPSQWEEAFGQVAVAPQFSGIPVIASARGGLPGAAGPGGILMDPYADAWAQAVRRLWNTPDPLRRKVASRARHPVGQAGGRRPAPASRIGRLLIEG